MERFALTIRSYPREVFALRTPLSSLGWLTASGSLLIYGTILLSWPGGLLAAELSPPAPGTSTPSSSALPPPAPPVLTPKKLFQKELDRIEEQGFELLGKASFQAEGERDHWIIILQKKRGEVGLLGIQTGGEEGEESLPDQHLRLYTLRGEEVVLLDEVKFPKVQIRFNGYYNLMPLIGNGRPIVALEWWNRRDCGACRHLRLWEIVDAKFKAIQTDLPPIDWRDPFPRGIVPKRMEDMDRDGIYELLSEDTRWEYYGELFAREDSPRVWVISSWKDGQYRETSASFASFYDQEIKRLRGELPEPEKTKFAQSYQGSFSHEETYLRVAFNIFLNYVQKGKKEEGWQELQRMVKLEKFTIWKSQAQWLLSDLKKRFSFKDQKG